MKTLMIADVLRTAQMNTDMQTKTVEIKDCGCIVYEEAYALQMECLQKAIAKGQQSLLLCEHPTVLTLGRLAKEEHILMCREDIEKQGVRIISSDRGGEVTLHAPGQLVIYPILGLRHYKKDLKYYICKLEQVGIDFLRRFDILACRVSGKTGVWVGTQKIASVGVGVKKWISYHGMAINLNTDLKLFSMIRPCGLDVMMTSVRKVLGSDVDMNSAKNSFVEVFKSHFEQNKLT